MRNAVIISEKDNVAVAVEPVSAGQTVAWLDGAGQEHELTAITDVPIYHKLALRDIAAGEKIVKYGQHIGEAGAFIPAGAHVHTDNVVSVREELGGQAAAAEPEADAEAPVGPVPTFYGYRRPDGRVGIRNHVLVLPASVCASDTAALIARQVEGAVSFHNQCGCSQVPADEAWTMEVLSGYAANPNVYGTIVISLGCEGCQMDYVVREIQKKTNKPLKQIIIQKAGGTIKTVELGVRCAREMAAEASLLQKEAFPVSELILGTECGGSDPTSGLAANPLIGEVCDRLVDYGGTAVLSETTEFIGGEHLLAARAATPEVHDRILQIVSRYEHALALVGEQVRDGNPSPGNKAGGLTTLEEKSLGCIHKGGHRVFQDVYDYAKPITKRGLVIMDTPGNDPASMAAMAAGGAHAVIFSSGQGTPTGHPLMPVIKITGNRETWKMMEDNTDLDASPVIYGPESLQEMTDRLFDLLMETANGRKTKAEALGFNETAIARVCNYT